MLIAYLQVDTPMDDSNAGAARANASAEVAQPDAAAFIRADAAHSFGPSFFLGRLGYFVRDHCPDQTENLPVVQVHLADAQALEVCHIIGVSPHWVMLAVRDDPGRRDTMVVDIIPYSIIQRVSIRTRRADGASIGFTDNRTPAIIRAESLLSAMMPRSSQGD